MRNFILGVIFTLSLLLLIGLSATLLGFLPTNANASPPRWERHLAMSALDASTEKHAARINSPVPPTAENLIDGMKIYTMNCAGCHGGLDRKAVAFGLSFYPPAPPLITDPPDDPDWHTYYVVRNGIRYTGMPAWEKNLSDPDIWKVTLFLSHIEKLPAPAQEYWKNAVGVAPPSREAPKDDHEKH